MNDLRNPISRLMVFILTLACFANLASFPGFCSDHSTTSAFADVAAEPEPSGKTESVRARVNETYGNLPMSFEANQGQFDSRVKFISRGKGYTMFLTADEAVLQLRAGSANGNRVSRLIETENPKPEITDSQRTILRMKLVGASDAPVAQGLDELPGRINYFVGSDSKKWRAGVATYAKALFKQVYPGIDLIYYGNQERLEYDLKVAPGASSKSVRLAFEGARRIRIDKRGDLILSMASGELRQHKPIAYQEINGVRKAVPARYVIKKGQQVGFEVARYDTSKPLVIDPELSYSTYLGGSEEDAGNGIAVDASGNAYITGFTFSTNFPTMAPLQPAAAGLFDVFITKLNATGTALIYSTYLGGDDFDIANGIAVDSVGNAYVTGQTSSGNFPTMNPIQPSRSTGTAADAFITKLNSTGSALVYSTYMGGGGLDEGLSIAADATGNAYVTGRTGSTNFPTANALQASLNGSADVFVSKLNPAGTALVYSTYIGGIGSESVAAIAIDPSGNAYVAGSTTSPDFPTANALQPVFKGKTVFKTVNGAGNWADINNGLSTHLGVSALAVARSTPSLIYAGTSTRELFKSTNSGANWMPINTGLQFPPSSINAIAIDPVNPNIVFVGANNGLFRTTDGGTTWNAGTISVVFSIAIDPVNTLNVYAGLRDFLAKSTDGGANFTPIRVRPDDSFLNAGPLRGLAINPAAPSTIYVGGTTFVFKSTNGGLNWELKPNSNQPREITTLVIDPINTSTLYFGNGFFVLKSTDSGDTWTRAGTDLSPAARALVIDPVTTSTIYAGTFGNGIFKSTNGGTSWAQMNNGLRNPFVLALAIDSVSTATLYSGSSAVNDGFALKLNQNASALLYSTYLGGDSADFCSDIAVDANGNAYLTGQTTSTDFPTANALQAHISTGTDAFVSKLNAAGTALVYSTYLGGSNNDIAMGIAVDANGNAYVAGGTDSPDFPVFAAVQSSLKDIFGDAFVTKLNATGTAFGYSTYLGGGSDSLFSFAQDVGIAIAVDVNGNAYVTGETFSSNFPTTPGAFQITRNDLQPDAFVSRISTFDICLQDEVNGNLLEFNSTTGEYKFSNCRKRFTLSGRGSVSTRFCKVELRANAPGHSITASANTCIHDGSASIQVSSQKQTYTINDKNTTNNTCSCQ